MPSPYLANIDYFLSLLVSCLAQKLTSLLALAQDSPVLPPPDPVVVPHGHQQGAENAFCNLEGQGTAPLGLAWDPRFCISSCLSCPSWGR